MAAPKIPFLLDRQMLSFGIKSWIALDLETPGIAIIGPSGTGKSMAASSLVGTLSILYPSARVYVLDAKGDPAFRFLHTIQGARYFPFTAALDGLREAYGILKGRMEGTLPLTPFVLIWLDELAGLLFLLAKKERDEVKEMISSITLQGRAMGVQLLLSVQRPDAELFTSAAARESLGHVIGLGRTTSATALMMGFDTDKLMPIPSGIRGAGHLLTAGTNQKAIQVPIVQDMKRLEKAIIHATTC